MKGFLFLWCMFLSCSLYAGEFFESMTDAQNAYIEENYIEACDRLKDAIRFSWGKVDLQARNVHFIKGGASGFNNYTVREELPFISGEQIHVYLEPIGFAVKKESDGYIASLTADYRLVDTNKNVLAEEKGFGDFEYKEISFFTEISLNMNFDFEGLVEGKYTLEITITDKLSGKSCTARKDFDFVLKDSKEELATENIEGTEKRLKKKIEPQRNTDIKIVN